MLRHRLGGVNSDHQIARIKTNWPKPFLSVSVPHKKRAPLPGPDEIRKEILSSPGSTVKVKRHGRLGEVFSSCAPPSAGLSKTWGPLWPRGREHWAGECSRLTEILGERGGNASQVAGAPQGSTGFRPTNRAKRASKAERKLRRFMGSLGEGLTYHI